MITKEELLKKIGELLDELKTQHESLVTGDRATKELDAELFEANAGYFASHVSVLNKLIGNEEGIGGAGKEGERQTSVTDEAETEGLPEVNPEPVKETIFTPATVVPEEKSGKEEEDDEVSGQENEEEEAEWAEEAEQAEQEEHAEESGRRDGEERDEEQTTPDDESEAEEAVADEEDPEQAAEEEEVQPSVNDPKPDRDNDATGTPANSNGSGQPVVQEVQIGEKQVTIPDERPSRPLTLNERLSAQRTQQAGSYYQPPSALQQAPQRVADLKTAISLNDKLLFIRDLFNGYSLAYSEAIELLNRFDNFADAQAFLEKNYAEKNSWVSKQQAVEKLYGILRKKFI